jgi:PAS domain S-box-containing protein
MTLSHQATSKLAQEHKAGSKPSTPAARRKRLTHGKPSRPAPDRSSADAEALLQELEVHQIELRMQNEELQQSQEMAQRALYKYTDLFEFAPICYFTLDAQGRIDEVNRAGAALLGMAPKEIAGKPFHYFVTQDRLKLFKAFTRRILKEPSKQTCEIKLYNRGKPPLEVLVEGVSAKPVLDRKRAWRLAVIDVTERNRVQAELSEYRERLEKLVQQRTLDLKTANTNLQAEALVRQAAEQKLQRSHGELEQTVARRTESLREMNHTLHQYTIQLRHLALELTRATEGERRQLAQGLHDNLQQILVAAKYHAETLERQIPAPPLREIAATVLQFLDEAIKATRSLTLELSPPILYDAGLAAALQWLGRWMYERQGLRVRVQVDHQAEPASEPIRILLFTATRELLFNIAKHAKVNEASVVMSPYPGNQVQILVSDQGAGFDLAHFKSKVASSGHFGLFSIRERVDALGGSLEIESAPSQGSRFTLRAPLSQIDHTPVPSGSVAAGAAGSSGTPSVPVKSSGSVPVSVPAAPVSKNHPTISILVVDDQTLVRHGLIRILQEQPDLEVVGQATNGQEAIEQARRLRPDVVLMDVNMPGLSGIEATGRLGAEHPGIKIIGLSINEKADQGAIMQAAGAVDYVNKAEASETLIKAIRTCCKRPHPAESPCPTTT